MDDVKERRSRAVAVRFTPTETERLMQHVEQLGLPLSLWVHNLVVKNLPVPVAFIQERNVPSTDEVAA